MTTHGPPQIISLYVEMLTGGGRAKQLFEYKRLRQPRKKVTPVSLGYPLSLFKKLSSQMSRTNFTLPSRPGSALRH